MKEKKKKDLGKYLLKSGGLGNISSPFCDVHTSFNLTGGFRLKFCQGRPCLICRWHCLAEITTISTLLLYLNLIHNALQGGFKTKDVFESKYD